jgi:hypothetical protein
MMSSSLFARWGVGILITSAVMAPVAFSRDSRLRSDVERELPALEAAYREAPGNHAVRRAYADVLVQLGDIWQANDVIAPLATESTSNWHDLELGGRLALMTCDYDRAEKLYKHLSAVARSDTEMHEKAIAGLALCYYQTKQFAQTRVLHLAGKDSDNHGLTSLLTFMQKFEGSPYQVEWENNEKVAHVKMVNNYRAPAALPHVKVTINGQTLEFVLDTGGDMLYVDGDVAGKVGIRNIHARRSAYAYTGGKTVDEPLGVADTVKLAEVTLRNVPVVVAKWKSLGAPGDGVVTTQILKQFLTTVDYEKSEITLRERSENGRKQLFESFSGSKPHRIPFFLSGNHLMFTKGALNGRKGLNVLLDSGLATSMPLVLHEETARDLGLEKKPVPGTKYFTASLQSHGIGQLTRGPTEALGNVLVENDPYWSRGFIFDALISHQYLYHLGSWSIDFDMMTYYFPSEVKGITTSEAGAPMRSQLRKAGIAKESADALKKYVGSYKSDRIKAEMEITIAGDKLSLSASGSLQGKFLLTKIGEHTFQADNAPQKFTIEFKLDGNKVSRADVMVDSQGPFPFKHQ